MIRNDREYRNLQSFETRSENENEYIVEGYASTFESYVLWDDGEEVINERIMPNAFDEADMSDIIFLYNHEGMVFARQKNGTLSVEVDDHGLKIRADLGSTAKSREMFEQIKAGLIDQMSFAFTVESGHFDRATKTRIIDRIGKVYDVSAVSIPANPDTDISARSKEEAYNGAIAELRAERLKESEELELLKMKFMFE